MAYTLQLNEREEQKKIVQSLMLRERDIFDHEQTLARFTNILADKEFVGSEMKDAKGNIITFRQKIELEIPVIEGRIAENKALIKSMEDLGLIPAQIIIDEIVTEIHTENTLANQSR